MKTTIQEERTGCGIACVATVMQCPYSQVKTKANSIGIFAEDEKLYSSSKYVRRLLKEYKIEASDEEILFKSWDELPDLAILTIDHTVDKGLVNWHWVVFVRENGKARVLDSAPSLENNERVDFDNMEPKFYIEVKKV